MYLERHNNSSSDENRSSKEDLTNIPSKEELKEENESHPPPSALSTSTPMNDKVKRPYHGLFYLIFLLLRYKLAKFFGGKKTQPPAKQDVDPIGTLQSLEQYLEMRATRKLSKKKLDKSVLLNAKTKSLKEAIVAKWEKPSDKLPIFSDFPRLIKRIIIRSPSLTNFDIEVVNPEGEKIMAKPDKKSPTGLTKRTIRNLLETLAIELGDVQKTLPNVIQHFNCDTEEDVDLSVELKLFVSTCITGIGEELPRRYVRRLFYVASAQSDQSSDRRSTVRGTQESVCGNQSRVRGRHWNMAHSCCHWSRRWRTRREGKNNKVIFILLILHSIMLRQSEALSQHNGMKNQQNEDNI